MTYDPIPLETTIMMYFISLLMPLIALLSCYLKTRNAKRTDWSGQDRQFEYHEQQIEIGRTRYGIEVQADNQTIEKLKAYRFVSEMTPEHKDEALKRLKTAHMKVMGVVLLPFLLYLTPLPDVLDAFIMIFAQTIIFTEVSHKIYREWSASEIENCGELSEYAGLTEWLRRPRRRRRR
jgi:hypothetical protein